MTPPWYPFAMAWRAVEFPQDGTWKGYSIVLLCRTARIPVKSLHCEEPTDIGSLGWTRTYGSLWLMSEGVYEIRSEVKDLEKYIAGKDALPISPPIPYANYGGTHYWSGMQQPHEVDDS